MGIVEESTTGAVYELPAITQTQRMLIVIQLLVIQNYKLVIKTHWLYNCLKVGLLCC